MNVLTFDIEEWFHLLDNDSTRTENQWRNFEVRIYENVDRILEILDRTNTKGTFFVLGWIAKTYPDLVKRIAEKYQIGSHTANHQLVWQQSPSEFRNDVESSVKYLQDITGKPVECFRAPGFSIRENESWAFEVLGDLGIKYDCSIFPARHAHGGMASYGAPVPSILKYGQVEIKEFPMSIKKILAHNVIFSGGGYFRLFPYPLIRAWSNQANIQKNKIVPVSIDNDGLAKEGYEGYVLSYIHPRDLDARQPVLKDLPLSRRFKSYVGLKTSAQKFEQYLNDFKFIDIQTASEIIQWDKVPIVRL